jgi:imidazolonepropionase
MRMGTAAVEIKSGYGLTIEASWPRVIKRLSQNYCNYKKATFLGAHAFHQNTKKTIKDILIY